MLFRSRGALDVIVANQRGPLLIYRNTVEPGRHWIQFELEPAVASGFLPAVASAKAGSRTQTHRSPIGSRVEVYWNRKVQAQEVAAASGFSAQSQRRVHYGLGTAASVDRVVIRWPSGRMQTIEKPAVDRLHRVKED